MVVDLARAAYLERPRNDKIRQIYEKFGMAPAASVQQAGVPVTGAATQVTAASFEAMVTDIRTVDMGVWREKMAETEGRVCRIEFNEHARGTGFLVGPDLVLTNYHVMEPLITGKLPSEQIACRFDYKVLADGSRSEGAVARLHNNNWEVDGSPYSPAEAENQPDRELPTLDQLDYAVMRLERPIGREPIGANPSSGAPPRGWIELNGQPLLEQGMPLLIAQHPAGSPLKLAFDTKSVIGVNGNGTRVRYATNTERGSSGSPCFSLDWQIVALHHLGDPSWKSPKFNQGVPIGVIAKRLAAAFPE